MCLRLDVKNEVKSDGLGQILEKDHSIQCTDEEKVAGKNFSSILCFEIRYAKLM